MAWNEWRYKNPNTEIDLAGANLTEADLSRADLNRADLTGANLTGANLYEADLYEADLTEADLTEAHLNRANLTRAILTGAILKEANLYEADLDMADLTGVYLKEADLAGANLNRAKLIYADLTKANLKEANLKETRLNKADLTGVDLFETDLTEADLTEARLIGSRLTRANLTEADFSRAIVRGTIFDDVDLSQVKSLETVKHFSPSTIGIDTIYKSKGNIPEVFLRGCGVPINFITFMHSLTGKAFDFYSCFISHNTKDKPFCERLYADLQAKDVRTWYFPEDAKLGEIVWNEIDRGFKKDDKDIKAYDKLVIVLSESSLQSDPVLRVLQRTLDREDKEHNNILFPITLDRYVFDTWEYERKADVLEKVVGDFVGWDKDAAKYQRTFEKLLKGLQAESAKK